MLQSVVITGMGVVCPIGVGLDEVWSSVEARRSGVRRIDDLARAGWVAPFGGEVAGFDAKAFVKPRKSLKVMADEIQWAFAAGEQACEQAQLEEGAVDPERIGVVTGAGLMYSDTSEMERPYAASHEAGRFGIEHWGARGIRQMNPLWMLKYLPNMSACHIGIRRDARGPTNTVMHADASSLLALSEAAEIIRRGHADVMITGGSSRRLYMTDPMWRAGKAFWETGDDPATACRPFDATRIGPVCGEGAAMLVLESRHHAQRRGARPIAEVLSVATRTEPAAGPVGGLTGVAIAGAITAAIEQAGVEPGDIGSVNAHGAGTPADDAAEAEAIRQTLGDTPVTAPKSLFGNLGAAGGAVELLVSLLAAEQGVVPPTINCSAPDPACPVNVATEATPTDKPLILALNHNVTGQAVAAILRKGED